MTQPFLEWIDCNHLSQRIIVVDKIFIGRVCKGIHPDKCIIVNHPDVSRDHAEVSLISSELYLTDRSKNGTKVNEIRVRPGSPVSLKHGDKIHIADTVFSIVNNSAIENDDCPSIAYTSPPTLINHNKKIITQFVADIRGFTQMSQKIQSELLYLFIKQIFETLSTIVLDHKGTIKDFTGDGIFAFWEHGKEFSNDKAFLACCAAIEQIKAIKDLPGELLESINISKDLKLGWGITTSHSIIAHYGSTASDIALLGDKVNFAFRLSDMANKDLPHDILLCAQTADLVKDKLKLTNLGPVPVRGYNNQEVIFAIKESAKGLAYVNQAKIN